MKQSVTSKPRRGGHSRLPALIGAIAVSGAILVLLREINYGVIVEWDAAGYLIRAQRMLAGPGWMLHLSGHQPPLYPILLALLGLPGWPLVHVAGLVNAAVFGSTIYFTVSWLGSRLQSRLLTVWAAFAIVLSIPLTYVATRAMTEPIFVLFTMLSLIRMEKFLDRDAPSALVWAAGFSALACLTRYMGGAVVIALVLLLLFRRNTDPREKFRQIAVFSFISAAPVCLFLLRNLLLSSSLFWSGSLFWSYDRQRVRTPLLENAQAGLEEFARWVVPASNSPPGVQDIFTVLSIVGLLSWAVAAGSIALLYRSSKSGIVGTWMNFGSFLRFTSFVLVYFIVLVISGLIVEINKGNFLRYLSPVYIPIIISISLAVDGLLRRIPENTYVDAGGVSITKKWPETAMLLPLAFCLYHPAVKNFQDAILHVTRGVGITSPYWPNADVVEFLEEHPVDDPIHTNLEEPLEYLTGLRTTSIFNLKHVDKLKYSPPTHIVYSRRHPSKRIMHAIEDLPGSRLIFRGRRSNVYSYSPPGRTGTDGDGIAENLGAPVIRSTTWDVHLDGDLLIYAKEASARNTDGRRFFLHIVPADRKHLPRARRWLGRDQLDWGEECSRRSGGRCLVAVRLPDYDIEHIRTGQYLPGPNRSYGDLTYGNSVKVIWNFLTTGRLILEDHVWEGEYHFDDTR